MPYEAGVVWTLNANPTFNLLPLALTRSPARSGSRSPRRCPCDLGWEWVARVRLGCWGGICMGVYVRGCAALSLWGNLPPSTAVGASSRGVAASRARHRMR